MSGIIDTYLSLYPLLEEAAAGEGSLFRKALGEIKREFQEYNITGAEKAKLLAAFVSSAYGNIAASSQKGALELARLATGRELEGTERELAAENLAKDGEVKAAQIAKINAEAVLTEKRAEAVTEREVSTALTGMFRGVSEMLGFMAQGGVAAPEQLIEASASFLSAARKHIDSLKPDLWGDSL
jgi:hypothetical protein